LKITADSAFISGENVNILEYSEILKELRLAGTDITFAGIAGRVVKVAAENLEILESAKITGDLDAVVEEYEISEDAKIKGESNIEISDSKIIGVQISLKSYLSEKIAEFVIILIVAIFVLGGFPKFTEANKKLHLRDFVKSFFTGILEIIVAILIAILIMYIGYAVGYAVALIALTIIFALLGRLIFILAFAIRISGKKEKVSKVKIFFMIVVVALAIEVIDMLVLLGTVGVVITMVFDFVIGISGFGTLFTVIFTSKKKILSDSNVIKEDKSKEETEKQDKANQAELQKEIKQEIREEIEELQKEKEAEKNIVENT